MASTRIQKHKRNAAISKLPSTLYDHDLYMLPKRLTNRCRSIACNFTNLAQTAEGQASIVDSVKGASGIELFLESLTHANAPSSFRDSGVSGVYTPSLTCNGTTKQNTEVPLTPTFTAMNAPRLDINLDLDVLDEPHYSQKEAIDSIDYLMAEHMKAQAEHHSELSRLRRENAGLRKQLRKARSDKMAGTPRTHTTTPTSRVGRLTARDSSLPPPQPDLGKFLQITKGSHFHLIKINGLREAQMHQSGEQGFEYDDDERCMDWVDNIDHPNKGIRETEAYWAGMAEVERREVGLAWRHSGDEVTSEDQLT
ncbi:hypothetical protein LTS18_002821 [Coniosporium uncinatum]|uniref:Uncharacterized protein n=1 Tax=Coniosporium uncinatum TaxID=93489 RepID=A0ACC3DU56_9PEZI|nr:hypothetical protein LTS18_002821 [Coniosporium uncinatum]